MPRCPNCTTTLTRSVEQGINLRACPGCFGNWISRVALLRLTRAPLTPEISAQPLEELAALVTEANSKTILRCPDCHIDMNKCRLTMMIPLQLQQCPKCETYWLDAGKLTLLHRLCFEMNNSTDPQVIELREKIAQTNLDWQARREQLSEAARVAKRRHNINKFIIRMLHP